ncbi:uncharacterized protein TRIADDRAFT_60412 [Trichoplax adhaerens]|uniref:Uncharacterized protein n=1 Tax=Trichoplax adhaerens TaxID=10228 RepID=B3S854_TRIAD|nr:predicted protein [Trichoplax adhaerens]EDV21137.1 predicted protein [Trichoplax adhaerens]|eukprot:XP_002116467.1 predicted protein [Trichoplax adhaerens]
MSSQRVMGICLFIAAADVIVSGLLTFIFNQSMLRSHENTVMIDLGVMELFHDWFLFITVKAITHGVLLLKVKDFISSTVTEACALTAVAIITAGISPATLTRMVLVLILSNYNSPVAFFVPMALAVLGIIIIEIISIYVIVKQVHRIHSDEDGYLLIQTPFNKSALSWTMMTCGLIIFGISITLFVERWPLYHVVTANLHAALLFATGILGIITEKKRVRNLNIWHKIFTTYTAGIGAASVVSIVRLLVFFTGNLINSGWRRGDFTALTLSQAIFTILGFTISLITMIAADDVRNKTPTYRNTPITDTTSAGMLSTAVIVSGIGIFNIAVMNYPTYGFPVLIVSVMAYVGARYGIDIQSTSNELAKYAYFVLNVFNSAGSFWAMAMSVYEFLADQNYQTSLITTYYGFIYAFTTITTLSAIVLAGFSIKAAVTSSQDLNNVAEGRINME